MKTAGLPSLFQLLMLPVKAQEQTPREGAGFLPPPRSPLLLGAAGDAACTELSSARRPVARPESTANHLITNLWISANNRIIILGSNARFCLPRLTSS